MDIVTHAIVGAATGGVFGFPVQGAIMGVVPDIVLGFKRRERPNSAYDITHSLPNLLISWLIMYALLDDWKYPTAMTLALFSHIVMDLPTHGKEWAPTLLYPFSKKRFSFSWGHQEWEWFNQTWWDGFEIATFWITVCLALIVILG